MGLVRDAEAEDEEVGGGRGKVLAGRCWRGGRGEGVDADDARPAVLEAWEG
jgi:hypothetical protein